MPGCVEHLVSPAGACTLATPSYPLDTWSATTLPRPCLQTISHRVDCVHPVQQTKWSLFLDDSMALAYMIDFNSSLLLLHRTRARGLKELMLDRP